MKSRITGEVMILRLFFGIKPDKNSKIAVNELINGLKCDYDGKYTIEDNLHITLVFIGDVETKLSYMLSQIGDTAFRDVAPCSISARGISSFKEGKITYLAINDSDALNEIYNRLTSLLDEAKVVYTHNDRYVPHMTLRRGKKVDIALDTDTINIDVREICLYESRRVDDVLRYIPIKTWRLGDR